MSLGEGGNHIKGGAVTSDTSAQVLSATALPVEEIHIQAPHGNTQYVIIGDADVTLTGGIGPGIVLAPGEAWVMRKVNIAEIYVVSAVSGEGVGFIYQKIQIP